MLFRLRSDLFHSSITCGLVKISSKLWTQISGSSKAVGKKQITLSLAEIRSKLKKLLRLRLSPKLREAASREEGAAKLLAEGALAAIRSVEVPNAEVVLSVAEGSQLTGVPGTLLVQEEVVDGQQLPRIRLSGYNLSNISAKKICSLVVFSCSPRKDARRMPIHSQTRISVMHRK